MNAPMKDRAAPEAPLARAVVDALPNPLIVLDADDRIAMANVAAEDYFQASSNVLLRHKLGDLVPFSSPVFGAVAQARFLVGNLPEAKSFAKRAQLKLAKNTPSWLRADDIINFNPPKD